jgi:hypothetical protein
VRSIQRHFRFHNSYFSSDDVEEGVGADVELGRRRVEGKQRPGCSPREH